MRRTRIVCTIGPASDSADMLNNLIQAGMNVARLNFSHGTQEEHGKKISLIREQAKKNGTPVAILQDLAGPKVRIGVFADDGIILETDQTFTLTNRSIIGDHQGVSLTYKSLPQEVEKGDTLLLSDGDLEMVVTKTTEEDIICRVVIGGYLGSRKGINLPTRSLKTPALTEKDREDLLFGLGQDVDYVALSFVREADDIREVKRIMEAEGKHIPVIAKIEKHEALKNIHEILDVADGIMIARGDLGVEIPIEHVPLVQKTLIDQANRAGKPVITATQMLRSMVDSPRPTRAEVTDVANAILDGTDAIMLSEETAIGHYPSRAVSIMSRIAEDAETALPHAPWMPQHKENDIWLSSEQAVARAACTLAHDIGAAAIITCTTSGSTAQLVAKCRPTHPILAPTPKASTYQRLALTWGTTPLMLPSVDTTDEMIQGTLHAIEASGHVKKGDSVVITAGVPLNTRGTTNLVRVAVIGTEPTT